MQFAKICLQIVNLYGFWSIASQYRDLVSCLHAQTHSMCNFGLNGGVKWLTSTNGASFFYLQKRSRKYNSVFLYVPQFRENFDLLLANLETKILR